MLPAGTSLFERYAADAKMAIYFALIEALHRNEKFISVGDLLVGITWDSESRASKIVSVKELAISLRSSVGIPHLPSTSQPYKRGAHIPLDDDAKKAVAYAAEEADQDRQYWIESDHLLRGLLRFPNNARVAFCVSPTSKGISARTHSEVGWSKECREKVLGWGTDCRNLVNDLHLHQIAGLAK